MAGTPIAVFDESGDFSLWNTRIMAHLRDLFKDFKELSSGFVKMGNDTYSPVKGIGSIKIRNNDGTQVILTDVRYMPNMARNLISLGTLEDKGCWFKSQDGVLKIVKGCSTILKGQKRETLYILEGLAEMGNHIPQLS